MVSHLNRLFSWIINFLCWFCGVFMLNVKTRTLERKKILLNSGKKNTIKSRVKNSYALKQLHRFPISLFLLYDLVICFLNTHWTKSASSVDSKINRFHRTEIGGESKPFPLVYVYVLVLYVMYKKHFPALGLEMEPADGRFCIWGELSFHTEDPTLAQFGHLEAEWSRNRVQIFWSFFKNQCLHTHERCWSKCEESLL